MGLKERKKIPVFTSERNIIDSTKRSNEKVEAKHKKINYERKEVKKLEEV